MNTTDLQQTPRKFRSNRRKYSRRRRKYRRRREKYPLYNPVLGHDYTMDRTWAKSLLDMFYNHVYVDWCPGSLHLWSLQPCTDNILRLKLQLSWVMGSRSLTLNRDEVLSEIVHRFQQSYPDNIYSSKITVNLERNFSQSDVVSITLIPHYLHITYTKPTH